MSTARYAVGSASPGTDSLAFGGQNASETDQTVTEEFTGETTGINLKTITDS